MVVRVFEDEQSDGSAAFETNERAFGFRAVFAVEAGVGDGIGDGRGAVGVEGLVGFGFGGVDGVESEVFDALEILGAGVEFALAIGFEGVGALDFEGAATGDELLALGIGLGGEGGAGPGFFGGGKVLGGGGGFGERAPIGEVSRGEGDGFFEPDYGAGGVDFGDGELLKRLGPARVESGGLLEIHALLLGVGFEAGEGGIGVGAFGIEARGALEVGAGGVRIAFGQGDEAEAFLGFGTMKRRVAGLGGGGVFGGEGEVGEGEFLFIGVEGLAVEIAIGRDGEAGDGGFGE